MFPNFLLTPSIFAFILNCVKGYHKMDPPTMQLQHNHLHDDPKYPFYSNMSYKALKPKWAFDECNDDRSVKSMRNIGPSLATENEIIEELKQSLLRTKRSESQTDQELFPNWLNNDLSNSSSDAKVRTKRRFLNFPKGSYVEVSYYINLFRPRNTYLDVV